MSKKRLLDCELIPRCGIVALAMAMKIRSCNDITVDNLMEKAKELLYTIQGELFDGKQNRILLPLR